MPLTVLPDLMSSFSWPRLVPNTSQRRWATQRVALFLLGMLFLIKICQRKGRASGLVASQLGRTAGIKGDMRITVWWAMVLSHAGLVTYSPLHNACGPNKYQTKQGRKLRHSYRQQEATVISLTESGSIKSSSHPLMHTKQNSPPTHASRAHCLRYKNPVRPSTQKQQKQSYTAGDSNFKLTIQGHATAKPRRSIVTG